MNNPIAEARFQPQDKLALHSQFTDYLAGKKVYPIGLEISPSGVCNATCPFCFYANTGELGEHRNVFLNPVTMKVVLRECQEMGMKSITWTGGGDPSLHPNIKEFVDYVHELGMEQGMFTNALAAPKYDPFKMKWIRITCTDKPFRLEHIWPLRGARTLGFAFNYAGPEDDDYLKRTLDIAFGLENCQYVQVRPALKFHGETVDIEPPKIEHPLLHVTWYKFHEAKKKHGYKECEGFHFVPFLWEDGNLDVCAYMRKHEGYSLGNVYKDSIKDILDRAPASVPVIDKCQVCCKLHEINLRIHSARAIEDRNFP